MSTKLRSLFAVGCLVALLGACSEKAKSGDAADAPQRRVLLKNLAERVYVPTYEAFLVEATNLQSAVGLHARTLSAETLAGARDAFERALAAWERAEVMQVGPAAIASDATPGGKGIRNEIYAYPQSFPCAIDRALVSGSYGDIATLKTVTSESGRGLVALESLLFDERTTTACKDTDSTATPEAWAKLVAGDLAQARADYAKTLSIELRKQAEALVSAWKGGFLDEFAKAGEGSKVFPTTHEALNAASDALFYVDTETKDMKLADPAGISMTCMATPCPEKVEHPHAKVSKASLVANLEAFRDVFRGLPPEGGKAGEMWGFYDLLVSVSAKDVGDEMNALIDQSLAEVNAIEPSLEEALVAKDKQIPAAYAKIQALCDRLKTDFLVKLDLKKPSRAAGDND